MIKLENIEKQYGTEVKVKALNKLSLQVKDGELLAIIGPSGSGKSTLLHIMAGLLSWDEGAYEYNDQDLDSNKMREKFRKEKVGIVLQNFGLLSRYTGYENIEIPLLASKVKRAERKKRVEEMAEKLGVSEQLEKYPTQMSGGQKQRIAIARACVTNPELLLADEPTGALDQENGSRILELFRKINKEDKRTVIIITHDLGIAKRCDRIVRIEDGKIIES